MLELKAAPSQNPVIPAANAAAPANAGEATSPEAALPQPGMSFAAVLKQHVGHGLEKKAVAPVDALLQASAAEAATAASVESPAADPIALLAPMLAGIAAPTSPADSAPAETLTVEPAGPAPDAAIIAAPLTVALPVADQTTATAPAPAPATASVVDNLPRQGEKPLPAAANIAAPAIQGGEGETPAAATGAHTDFDALLHVAKEAQVLANPHAPVRAPQASTPAAASAPVATPVGAPGWGSEIGDKVVWMVGRQETRADLVLNPPQLGRIEVSVSMNGDQANTTFISANASVREALESAMPRLREVLQNAGISLGQTQVGAESFQQSAEQRQTGDNPGRGHSRAAEASPGLALGHDTAPGQWLKRGNGLVDTFA